MKFDRLGPFHGLFYYPQVRNRFLDRLSLNQINQMGKTNNSLAGIGAILDPNGEKPCSLTHALVPFVLLGRFTSFCHRS